MSARRVKGVRWDIVALIAVWVVVGFTTGLTAACLWWVAGFRCRHSLARLSSVVEQTEFVPAGELAKNSPPFFATWGLR
jgi:uncharacterized membrane protein